MEKTSVRKGASIGRLAGRRPRIRVRPSMAFLYVFMILLVLFTALPLVYMISTAFKPLGRTVYLSSSFFCQKAYDAESF